MTLQPHNQAAGHKKTRGRIFPRVTMKRNPMNNLYWAGTGVLALSLKYRTIGMMMLATAYEASKAQFFAAMAANTSFGVLAGMLIPQK